MQKCEAKTRTGAACRAPAGAKGLCFLHANPGIATSLGRRGGQKNRRSPLNLELPDNMTAADIRKVIVQAIRLLLSGELRAREASALTQLLNSLHRAIPAADLEARVALLEDQLGLEENGAQDVDPIESQTNEIVATAEGDVLPAAEQTPCPTDAPTLGLADGGGEAGSRSDEPDEAVQEENVVPPEVDPIGSAADEIVADAESDVLLAAEQTSCPTDAKTSDWTDGGDEPESRSEEPDEAVLEKRGAPPEVDPIESPTNETVADAESDVLAAEQTACPTDAQTPGWTDGGDGAEGRSDEPDEAGEA
jgi:hypothetical protein